MQKTKTTGTSTLPAKPSGAVKIERIIAAIAVVAAVLLGELFLKPGILLRLVIGLALGYTLMRAYTGFAGSVNRAYRTGSTKLMRAMMLMFLVSSILTAGLLYGAESPESYGLWVNSINMGLIAGGLLFGFGMALSSCCASGVLTDLSAGFSRAFITLVFFGLGVFLGFPVQNSASWVKDSWFSSPVGEATSGGVFLPDWFSGDGFKGYLGAIILTAFFCGIVVVLAYLYEKKRKLANTYSDVDTEALQSQEAEFKVEEFKIFSESTYQRVFVKPWTLVQGALVLSVLFTILMAATKAGWGASTPYGIWFAKVLMIFGVSPDALASFTLSKAETFTVPFFEHGVSVQNLGIIVGTMLYLLSAGIFSKTFKDGLKVSGREVLIFALGGIVMGFGTRLSNGCNVGALYTPIANFSLSGWIFFIALVLGAVGGNVFSKLVSKKDCDL